MNSDNDSTETDVDIDTGQGLSISRRNVLISSGTASVAASTGCIGEASANEHSADKEPEEKATAATLTVKVTGLERDGPLPDADVIMDGKRQKTDDEGIAAFEVEEGRHEITIMKRRWEPKSKTVTVNKEEETLHIPMHIREYNEVITAIYDACLGTPVEDATVSVHRERIERTNDMGIARLLLENQLEPMEYPIRVEHPDYHAETQRIRIDEEDMRTEIEMLPR